MRGHRMWGNSFALKTPGRRGILWVVSVLVALLPMGCSVQGKITGEPVLRNEPSTSAVPRLDLLLCKTRVSNPPAVDGKRVVRQSALACQNGVALMVAPAPQACLTSGFGSRSGRLHKGIDFQSKPTGSVVAAGSGVIMESSFRQKDFGNWIVIDHGSNLFTGYAHLASVAADIRKGVHVERGQVLGVMGSSGDATTSIHLHYEVRHGNMATARSFFRLTPVDPFDLPGTCKSS